MQSIEGIDAERVTAWFVDNIDGATPPLSFELIAGGRSNLTFRVTDSAGHDFVLRRPPTSHVLPTAHDMGREHRIISALQDTPVPVAPALGFCDDESVNGRPFYVMEAVDGRVPSDNPPYTFDGSWVLDLDRDEQRAIEDNGIDILGAIHRIPQSGWEPVLAGRVPFGLDATLDHWESLLRWAAEGRSQPVAERGLAWLRAHRADVVEAEPALCWGDARIGNVIFGDDLHPAAVLDWEMASIGDPVLDLSWWLALERHFGPVLGMPQPPGFPTRDEQVARWELATGRRAEHLEYYEVFAGFRYSVVMIRVARLMIGDGVLPADTDFERDNTATATLDAVLAEVGP